MKRILTAVFTVLSAGVLLTGSACTCCSEKNVSSAEINSVMDLITKDLELMQNEAFDTAIKSYVPEYTQRNADGTKFTYEDFRLVSLMATGKNPEAFLILIFKHQNRRAPNPEELAGIREQAKDDDVAEIYPVFCEKLRNVMNKNYSLGRKTLTFKKVEVDGRKASAVYEIEVLDTSDKELKKTKKEVRTVKLQKDKDGWKFLELNTK